MIRSIIATGDLERIDARIYDYFNHVDHQLNSIIIFIFIPPLFTGPQVLYTPGLLPARKYINVTANMDFQLV